MEEKKYTERQIAILTDIHALYEPTEAILQDISRRGITEIYSLGDNIGEGPNPEEVMTLLEQYGVISISGNAEEYIRLGLEPFPYIEDEMRKESCRWTRSKLSERSIGNILLYPHFIELIVGGKKIGLCHFANDVRFDFIERSAWSYQAGFEYATTGKRTNENASKQFAFTNSDEQKEEMRLKINDPKKSYDSKKGLRDALKNPLFNGEPIASYDAIIQGHVHWKLYDPTAKTHFYTIRAAGMAYRESPVNAASYVIIREKQNNEGFDLEEILVEFDREKMITAIMNCTNPEQKMIKFASITEEEKKQKQNFINK